MGTFIFHNKFHRNVHHTVPTSGFPDSASDPIASEKYPFLGVFYNSISNSVSSNSQDWANTFTTISSNSAVWDLYLSVFTTVKSNSALWQNNLSVYTTYNSTSSNFNSAYSLVLANSGFWNRLYFDTVLYKNRVQQDTRQKNFATLEIKPDDISNIILNLSAGQVSYYVISDTSNVSGFVGAKRGGKYHFYTTTDGSCLSTVRLNFNPQHFKFPLTNTFTITGTRLGKFEFFSDGTYLHGKGMIFDAVDENDANTYFSGSGINLNPNPYVFSNSEGINVDGGLLVQGVFPYNAGAGIEIVYVPPCP
jgi:hypothetical protein